MVDSMRSDRYKQDIAVLRILSFPFSYPSTSPRLGRTGSQSKRNNLEAMVG